MKKRNLLEKGWGLYQQIQEKMGIQPNFWCSLEYIAISGWLFFQHDGWIWFSDPEQPEIAMLPPLHVENTGKEIPKEIREIWCDFGKSDFPFFDFFKTNGFSEEFLDSEYIFRAGNFFDMSGGKWALFRKNSRKWPERNKKIPHVYRCVNDQEDVVNLLIKWLNGVDKTELIEDSETLIEYLPSMKNRCGLYRGAELVGLNAWDDNFSLINFRYSICEPEPFLSDYLRLLFYKSLEPGTLVNDGGVLGKPSLKFFKDKMNPFEVNRINTWKRG